MDFLKILMKHFNISFSWATGTSCFLCIIALVKANVLLAEVQAGNFLYMMSTE